MTDYAFSLSSIIFASFFYILSNNDEDWLISHVFLLTKSKLIGIIACNQPFSGVEVHI